MEKLYTVSKNNLELTAAQIMSSLLQNSVSHWESRENHKAIQVWPKSKPSWLYSVGDKWIQEIRSDRVPEELWMEIHNTVKQEAVTKTIQKKKKCKKSRWLSQKALQIAEKRREVKA